ncbi:MAG: HDIG domain-containing protein [Candidatus Lokiarchaeota archaeon]|nr:HDIG domain-containing protein [Candidatus Lokiarchaeota archaeon]
MKSVNLADSIKQHSIKVAMKALEIVDKINTPNIDRKLVEIGGLLHDIGRSKTHGFDHGLIGSQILKEIGLSQKLSRICETHMLGGLDINEAKELELPEKNYLPTSLEEKIICLADKYLKGTKEVSIDERFEHWFDKYENSEILKRSKIRIINIENEIKKLI